MAKPGTSNNNSSPTSHVFKLTVLRSQEISITKVTFTHNESFLNIHFVVWQFWGRAAEASLTEKSRALFHCLPIAA